MQERVTRMADVKWIKIATDIFSDEKILLIESLPKGESILLIWFKLLCLAGKMNNSGVFKMENNDTAYTPAMLAVIFGQKESMVHLAIRTFEQYGMIEIVNGVITIPNWGKHQNLDKIETKKAYMKNYMSAYREKQKKLSCKTNSKANNDINSGDNSKANSKANVSLADKEIELDKELDKDIDTEKRKKKIAKEKVELLTGHAGENLVNTICDFVEYRWSINKPIGDKDLSMIIDDLEKLSQDESEQIAIIRQSIDNGWSDIRPLPLS